MAAIGAIPRDEGNPIWYLANAIGELWRGMSAGLNDMNQNLMEIRGDISGIQAAQDNLESRVDNLEVRSRDESREALDKAIAAYTLAQGCEPYTLAFSGLPVFAPELTRDLMVGVGKSLSLTFSESAITDFWRAKSPGKGTDTGNQNSVPTLLVKFAFARLRDSMLASIRKAKGVVVNFPGIPPGTKMKAFEVLTGQNYAKFNSIRFKGRDLEASVWHFDGAIRARGKNGAKPIFVNNVRFRET